ncbi:uncharacterized protein [Argopecten irradians]|uniref:uncharacterized protein n=1 Tax=Argopecten irradians TaxID=31199 RepID=UPI00371713A6
MPEHGPMPGSDGDHVDDHDDEELQQLQSELKRIKIDREKIMIRRKINEEKEKIRTELAKDYVTPDNSRDHGQGHESGAVASVGGDYADPQTERLKHGVKRLKKKGWASSTSETYKTHLQTFFEFL